jgi:hypothetical protein
MLDYPVPGGPFEIACAELLASGFTIPYFDLEEDKKPQKKKLKVKYSCPQCGTNVWGKAELSLICGGCHVTFVSDEPCANLVTT